MAKNKRQNAKKNDEQEQKKLQEKKDAERLKLEREKQEREEKEKQAKARQEEKDALHEAKMERVKRYKYTITVLGALCFAFAAGLLYNLYCTNGHVFDGEIDYLSNTIDSWHFFNGRYVRMSVDSAFDWYSGTAVDEDGKLVMSGKTASCMIWLDSDAFISLTVDNEEDFENINSIIEETAKYVDSLENETTYDSSNELSFYFEGQLRRPSSTDLAAYKKEFSDLMDEWGFETDDYYLYELTLDTTADRSIIKATTIAYIALAILFLAATIVVAVKYHYYKKINGIKIVRE